MKNFMKAGRALGAGAVALSFAAGAMAPKANAATGIYLTGAAEYVPLDSDGNGSNHFGYFHSTTNSTDSSGVKALNISPGTSSNLSVLLNPGDNNFTITPGIDSSPNLSLGEGSAAMFFFNNTGVSFNPTTGGPLAGDLVVWASAGSSAFHIPASGTQVLDYLGRNDNPDNSYPFLAPYSGATSFTIGFDKVTVTAFTAGDKGANPSDTFTLHVEELPEPASLGILAVGGVVILRRRR